MAVNIIKEMDFKGEEMVIPDRVGHGLRCSDCLKPFNAGERKHFKAGSNTMICQRCHASESSCNIPREEAAIP